GYTSLDSSSPARAWPNKVNICATGSTADSKNQFAEVAAPHTKFSGIACIIFDFFPAIRNASRRVSARWS
ncbi:MAG: hypothetical protein MJ016_05790, partial [Victivallaceae bacterium]|nr:hypothetical protein [Victivallaceae bacterium]